MQMKKRYSEPQIVAKLREADILLGQGKTFREVLKCFSSLMNEMSF